MINIENLSKTFNLHILNDKEICAFNDISFELDEGEFLGLSGPGGAGKSSIPNSIYRTYLPTGGHIWHDFQSSGMVDQGTAMIGILHDRELMSSVADRVYPLQEVSPDEA